jgi:hypothetical protein
LDAISVENVAVLFLDLQDEIVKNSRTVPIEGLRRSVGALAKLTALHRLPSYLSAVPPGGAYLSVVLDPLGKPEPLLAECWMGIMQIRAEIAATRSRA